MTLIEHRGHGKRGVHRRKESHVDRADIRMIQGRRSAGLAPKPFQRRRVMGNAVGKKLKNDKPSYAGVSAL